jgi:hypothetical protein
MFKGRSNAFRAGTLARKNAVQEALTYSLSGCGMSREDVAAEMARLTGEPISRGHIDNWCSEGKRDWRFPLEYVTAFCVVTGDYGLVAAVLAGTGQGLADEETRAFAELGQTIVEERKISAKLRGMKGNFGI